MAKNIQKLSLANKLAQKVDTQSFERPNRTDNLMDIEDLLAASSPQKPYTRKQRQLNEGSLEKVDIKSEPLSPTGNPPKKKRQPPVASRVILGSAVVVKCKVVPDAVDSPVRVNRIRTEVKQEPVEKVKQEPLEEVKQEPFEEVADTPEAPEQFPGVQSPHPLWFEHLENVRVMRNSSPAPVDTMGCHRCADPQADPKTQRFQHLVALMLSSQTKDQTTYDAMNRLKERTLTPQSLNAMPVAELEQLLHPVCFYKNKAKYLKQTVQILIEKYDSDIPDNPKELIALPGVGPKMAHICMAVAFNKVTGIGVDVHVHRISNRLGWVPNPTKEPEQTRVALQKWLPQSLWMQVNHLFVGFGQTVCTPTKPNCGDCLNKHICPSAGAETQRKKRNDRVVN